MSTSEPNRSWLVMDKDSDLWRYDADLSRWTCAAGVATWTEVINNYGPVQIFGPVAPRPASEVRGTISRALCMDDTHKPWPCESCIDDANDVLAALVEAGDIQTDDGAATPGQVSGGSPPGPAPEASEVAAGPAPSSPSPRMFQLIRNRDISGVSGTGPVAEGVVYTDGTVALRWYGANAATAVWPSLEAVLAVHGHQGATEVSWLDEKPVGYWPVTEGSES